MSSNIEPTEDDAKTVSHWDVLEPPDAHKLMAFVRDRWWYADAGFWQMGAPPLERQTGTLAVQYVLATGGWSDNEMLIDALQENRPFWMFFWESSHRGGRYTFIIPGAP